MLCTKSHSTIEGRHSGLSPANSFVAQVARLSFLEFELDNEMTGARKLLGELFAVPPDRFYPALTLRDSLNQFGSSWMASHRPVDFKENTEHI